MLKTNRQPHPTLHRPRPARRPSLPAPHINPSLQRGGGERERVLSRFSSFRITGMFAPGLVLLLASVFTFVGLLANAAEPQKTFFVFKLGVNLGEHRGWAR